MDSSKINKFMDLAGQARFTEGTPPNKARELGAQLLLSEVLEYVIKGLKVIPIVNGVKITDPNNLEYLAEGTEVDIIEMIDGLADVAYTMYWNSEAFAIPLEEAFELVCDNNLEKFVELSDHSKPATKLSKENWHCGKNVSWPIEVESVEVIKAGEQFYAVGKDKNGKVRKPSSYKSVDLSQLLKNSSH